MKGTEMENMALKEKWRANNSLTISEIEFLKSLTGNGEERKMATFEWTGQ